MGDSCAECARSKWAWFGDGWGPDHPELMCTKPTVTDPVTGKLVLPATECGRIKPGYGPPQAMPPYFYPWPCEFEAAGYMKEPPRVLSDLERVGRFFRLTTDRPDPDMLHSYADSLGAEVSG